MLLRTRQSVIAVEKTLKYQLNESYAEGFNDAREHIAKLIESVVIDTNNAYIPNDLKPEAKLIWETARVAFANVARNLK